MGGRGGGEESVYDREKGKVGDKDDDKGNDWEGETVESCNDG